MGPDDGENRLFVRHDLNPAPDGDLAFIALARNVLEQLIAAVESGDPHAISRAELDQIDVAAHTRSGHPRGRGGLRLRARLSCAVRRDDAPGPVPKQVGERDGLVGAERDEARDRSAVAIAVAVAVAVAGRVQRVAAQRDVDTHEAPREVS
jgi:hypothetical protein